MIYKLNSEVHLKSAGCDLSEETSENKFEIDSDKPGGIKDQVGNYQKVMTKDFGIPEGVFFNTIPININHLLSFINNNSKDLAATRLYLAKKKRRILNWLITNYYSYPAGRLKTQTTRYCFTRIS